MIQDYIENVGLVTYMSISHWGLFKVGEAVPLMDFDEAWWHAHEDAWFYDSMKQRIAEINADPEMKGKTWRFENIGHCPSEEPYACCLVPSINMLSPEAVEKIREMYRLHGEVMSAYECQQRINEIVEEDKINFIKGQLGGE